MRAGAGAGATRHDLGGQAAVVTGGAAGIGAAVAERLAASGARVAIWDLEAHAPEPRVAALGPDRLLALRVDVADWDAVREAARATRERLGRIDILVNSAGVAGPTATLADYPPEAWARVQAINLGGTFHACKAVVPAMVEQGYGRIVNIASIAGKEGNPNASAYSASKAAVIALTKSLGKELAAHDIAVNCVTPTTARTRLLDQVAPEFIEYMRAKIPRGRFVTVEEVAAMTAWMASPENSFTTGAVFDLSGGRATY
jgi:3-oxoacyl-[acyl-carrier protein] reductase